MNTPADKPDLPSFEVSFSIEPNRKWSDFDVAKYASQAADEREAWARADERRKARAELIAEITAPGPVAYKWRTAARFKTGTPGPWHLSQDPFAPVPCEVDQIACYAIPKE